MSYDLRYEPWILCRFADGTRKKIGFFELFEKAHEIECFEHDNPLAEASLMPILLALAHRILDGPADKETWKRHYEKGRYESEAIQHYFKRWNDRFDLFDEKYPFMQTPGLQMLDKHGAPTGALGCAEMIPHIAKGHNATLFDHTLDSEIVTLPPEEALYWILVAQGFLPGGLFKKTTNLCRYQANCKNGHRVGLYHAYAVGENLFETMMFNTLIYNRSEPMPSGPDDAPFWETPDHSCEMAMPRGYLDYLTFTSRLVRVEGNKKVGATGFHLACGRHFRESFKEPFVPTRLDHKEEWKPLKPSIERSLWRDSPALFASEQNEFRFAPLNAMRLQGRSMARKHPRIVAYGMINKQANVLGYRKEMLPLPSGLLARPELKPRIDEAVGLASRMYEKLKRSIKSYCDTLDMENTGPAARAKALYWSALDLPFRTFLDTIEEAETLDAWHTTVCRAAKDAFAHTVGDFAADKARTYLAYAIGESRLYCEKEKR